MRDRVSQRGSARGEGTLVAKAFYKVGDVVVTGKPVSCVNSRGKREGTALPGWKWRIVGVDVQYAESGAKWVVYRCVSHDEPLAYSCTLRQDRIARAIGRHEGELLVRKK